MGAGADTLNAAPFPRLAGETSCACSARFQMLFACITKRMLFHAPRNMRDELTCAICAEIVCNLLRRHVEHRFGSASADAAGGTFRWRSSLAASAADMTLHAQKTHDCVHMNLPAEGAVVSYADVRRRNSHFPISSNRRRRLFIVVAVGHAS